MIFKILNTNEEVDISKFIRDYLILYDNSKIYIGCDSQNRKNKTIYATVIVLHNNKGGRVLYNKDIVPKIKDNFTKLWNEAEHSLKTAQYLLDLGLPKADFIDLDFNPDPKYKSNNVLLSAVGYIKSLGYETRVKPHALSASYAADKICKNTRRKYV